MYFIANAPKIYFRLELLYGLGPSLYLFSKSITNSEFKIRKFEYLHFLPVIIEFIYYRTSYYRIGKIDMTKTSQNIYNDIFSIEQRTGVISTSIYMVLSIIILLNYKKNTGRDNSKPKNKPFKWLYIPIIAYVSYWCLWFTFRYIDVFLYSGMYSPYYYFPMFILLSGINVWIGFQGYLRIQTNKTAFSGKKNKKLKQKESDESFANIISQINEYMEKEKLYLDSDLNITSFANRIGIQSRLISKAINNELKINFHEFVNRYRVNEFKKRIKNENSKNLTLLGHAFESGFASKSTFNYVFKKYTELTPRQFYNQYKNNKSENVNSDD